MPQLEALSEHPLNTMVASVGGSVFRPDRIDVDFTKNLIAFFREQTGIDKHVVAVIGGGGVARNAIEDAQTLGVTHQPSLDRIGILVTQENAHLLAKIIEANGMFVHLYEPGDLQRHDVVYLRGGTDPGHTTDYVAVQLAIEANQCVLINISSTRGLYARRPDGSLDPDALIDHITANDYLKMFPHGHSPGVNIPFDCEAIKLAIENNMMVILVGPNFDNMNQLLRGERFVGTIIHPNIYKPEDST